MPRRSGAHNPDWVRLTVPAVEVRTNNGAALPVVAVRISNVGSHAVDFRLCWFECRAKEQKTLLATNRFASVVAPLGPGRSTNLIMNILPADLPVGEYWCCGEVLWAERESLAYRCHKGLDRFLNRFDLTKNPRWYSKDLAQGSAIAGNVDPADYFRAMYGKSRSQWMELARKVPQIMVKPVNNQIYFPGSNELAPEERARSGAESAFADFCRDQ